MTYQEIISKLSELYNIPYNIIDSTYKAYWLFIRLHIKELPLKDNLSNEEFKKLRTNFNIPSLGKLSCTYNRMKGMVDLHNKIKLNAIH